MSDYVTGVTGTQKGTGGTPIPKTTQSTTSSTTTTPGSQASIPDYGMEQGLKGNYQGTVQALVDEWNNQQPSENNNWGTNANYSGLNAKYQAYKNAFGADPQFQATLKAAGFREPTPGLGIQSSNPNHQSPLIAYANPQASGFLNITGRDPTIVDPNWKNSIPQVSYQSLNQGPTPQQQQILNTGLGAMRGGAAQIGDMPGVPQYSPYQASQISNTLNPDQLYALTQKAMQLGANPAQSKIPFNGQGLADAIAGAAAGFNHQAYQGYANKLQNANIENAKEMAQNLAGTYTQNANQNAQENAQSQLTAQQGSIENQNALRQEEMQGNIQKILQNAQLRNQYLISQMGILGPYMMNPLMSVVNQMNGQSAPGMAK